MSSDRCFGRTMSKVNVDGSKISEHKVNLESQQ